MSKGQDAIDIATKIVELKNENEALERALDMAVNFIINSGVEHGVDWNNEQWTKYFKGTMVNAEKEGDHSEASLINIHQERDAK